jgi:hypothetical protein
MDNSTPTHLFQHNLGRTTGHNGSAPVRCGPAGHKKGRNFCPVRCRLVGPATLHFGAQLLALCSACWGAVCVCGWPVAID